MWSTCKTSTVKLALKFYLATLIQILKINAAVRSQNSFHKNELLAVYLLLKPLYVPNKKKPLLDYSFVPEKITPEAKYKEI